MLIVHKVKWEDSKEEREEDDSLKMLREGQKMESVLRLYKRRQQVYR